MESKTKNRKTRQQIAAMAARAFGGVALEDSDDAVVELKEGWFNVSYDIRLADGREVILKIAPPKDAEVMLYEKNIMATEVSAMRLVRGNPAIPAPEIYFYDNANDLCDADYFFMEKISGDNLEHVKADLSPETRTAIDLQIGEIVSEINSFTGSDYFGYAGNPDLRAATWKEAFIKIVESVLEDAARKDVVFNSDTDHRYSYDELRAAIHKHAASLDEVATPRLVHWDAWDANLFVKDGKISGIIDFERALWGDPLMEAQFRQLLSDDITDAMRGYGKTSFTVAEEQRKRLYSLHLGLVINTECYYRDYDTDFAYEFSKWLIGATMGWLEAN